MLEKLLNQVFEKFVVTKPAKCEDDHVPVDDPNFARLDPFGSGMEDGDMDPSEGSPIERMRYPRRPPSFDMVMNPVKAITKKPDHVKGFRFEVAGGLSNNFHLSHIWQIRPPVRNPMKMNFVSTGGYTLAAQFMGGELKTPYDHPKIIMTARMDSHGHLDAAIIKKLKDMFTLKLQASFPNTDINYAQAFLECDMEGDDYVASGRWGTGMAGMSYMQSIGQKLSGGFEFTYIPARKMSILGYAARYIHNNHNFYFQYNPLHEAMNVGYLQKLTRRATVVTDFTLNPNSGETDAVLGLRQKFTGSEVAVTMNSRGKISSLLSVLGMMYTLKLCASVDYRKDSYKFGYSIGLGQTQ